MPSRSDAVNSCSFHGFDFGLHHQCRVGLTLGIPPQTLKAMLLELLSDFQITIPELGRKSTQGDAKERSPAKNAIRTETS